MARSLALYGELAEVGSPPRAPIARKGFRPFFALAAAYAVLIVPIWLAVLTGVASPSSYLDPVTWHAHEMIFGFTVAVIAGFLLTAVGNWTQRETVVGLPLLALAGLWLLGRVAMVLAARLPRGLPALVDLAFLPLLTLALARPLVAARNRRNFVMLAILTALFAANVAVHLDALGVIEAGSARRACAVALDVVLLVMLIVAGRVFPMFTRNATRVASIRSSPVLDVVTIAGMAVLVFVDALPPQPRAGSVIAGLVGVAAMGRAIPWGARHSLRDPLLWILHAGYAWLVVGLLLRGGGALGTPSASGAALDLGVPSSLATHASTVGAIGSLTLGMMARVALGHTGRPLVASRSMRWAFAAICAAAFVRVVVPLLVPSWYLAALIVAGTLWSSVFLAFLVIYLPILTSPRLDGRPG
jgi:uncharacterized protein involved in response to NO